MWTQEQSDEGLQFLSERHPKKQANFVVIGLYG